MIKLCRNLFYKPKYGSDADSIMLKRLFSTVAVVLVCLSAISFSAYAYFSYTVTSGTNTIKSSSFSTTVTIKKNDTLVNQGDIQNYLFEPGEYTVTITRDSAANGTGFCMIHVGEKTYYTQQLGVDLNAPSQERIEISFVLDVKAATTVAFDSCWGTTSFYNSMPESNLYIKNTVPLTVITVNATQGIADNTQETTLEETNPAETTPEETTPEETEPEEAQPEETQPEETQPEETQPEETQPEETQPEETTSPAEPVETAPSQIVYTIADDDNLAQIALTYNTTYQRIAAYNGIENPRVILPGQEILIPPADWVMPTETTE